MKKITNAIIFILLLLKVQEVSSALMLHPTRVIFEGRTRSKTIELMNKSNTSKTYRLEFVNRKMTENGKIVIAEPQEKGELFAEQLVRFSPRQVTLAPGATQTVRLMLRKPANLENGEYRSHLQFNRIADISDSSDIENITKISKSGMSFELQTLVSVAIPVMVRHGELVESATIPELNLTQSPTKNTNLTFSIHRTGNSSTYGNLTATFLPKDGSDSFILGKKDGVSVYIPNKQRHISMPLTWPDRKKPIDGRIELTYIQSKLGKQRGSKSQEGELLSKKTLLLSSNDVSSMAHHLKK